MFGSSSTTRTVAVGSIPRVSPVRGAAASGKDRSIGRPFTARSRSSTRGATAAAESGGVNAWARRHTLGWYFALAFGLSWTAVALVGGPDGLLGRAPPAGERLLLLLPAMLLGPVAAGLGLTALTGGRAALT